MLESEKQFNEDHMLLGKLKCDQIYFLIPRKNSSLFFSNVNPIQGSIHGSRAIQGRRLPNELCDMNVRERIKKRKL